MSNDSSVSVLIQTLINLLFRRLKLILKDVLGNADEVGYLRDNFVGAIFVTGVFIFKFFISCNVIAGTGIHMIIPF